MVKNLAQLKRFLQVGAEFDVVEHFFHPQYTGQHRKVKSVQTNAFYSTVEGDDKIENLNYGKGLYCAFESAKHWTFNDDGTITLLKRWVDKYGSRNGKPNEMIIEKVMTIKLKEV